MKKRIKTRRLTNIYHSDDDDDVGDGSNLLSPPSLSLLLSLSRSFSLFPIYQSTVARAKIFEHSEGCSCYWLQPTAYFSNITVIIRV